MTSAWGHILADTEYTVQPYVVIRYPDWDEPHLLQIHSELPLALNWNAMQFLP